MIKFGARFRKTLHCSFCGKSQYDLNKLIAGPAVFICDQCVTTCVDVLRDSGGVSSAPVQRRRFVDRVRDWFAGVTMNAALATRFSR